MIWMLGIMTAMAQDPAVTAQTATSDEIWIALGRRSRACLLEWKETLEWSVT